MLFLDDASTLSARLHSTAFKFVGVVSFERRSTAWLSHVRSTGAVPSDALIFDYDTVAEPEEEDRLLRSNCRTEFSQLLLGTSTQFLSNSNAFAFNTLRISMLRELSDSRQKTIVFDITCMTRVHLFATVSVALKLRDAGCQVSFVYTAATGYGFLRQDLQGWRDVLFVSASDARLPDVEPRRFGVISVGHDGERLSVALQELEPVSGVMLYALNDQRPDFTSRALKANEIVQSRLSRLRGPAIPGESARDSRWKFEQIAVSDFESVHKSVAEQAAFAKAAGGGLAIYPFGPKPMSLCIANAALSFSDVPAWVVYPIPERFSVSYSSGVGEFFAYGIAG